MHRPLAQALAERGNRVITLDLLGHGESDSEGQVALLHSRVRRAVEPLLDHLESTGVGGGTSRAKRDMEAAAGAGADQGL